MYDITDYVYGFNFSDGKYPDLCIELSDVLLEYVTDSTLFESPYTGHCESPCYLGVCLEDDDNDLSPFELVESFNNKLSQNKEKYDIEIKNKISEILEDLIENKDSIIDDDPSLEEPHKNMVEYFTILKDCLPEKFTVTSTS